MYVRTSSRPWGLPKTSSGGCAPRATATVKPRVLELLAYQHLRSEECADFVPNGAQPVVGSARGSHRARRLRPGHRLGAGSLYGVCDPDGLPGIALAVLERQRGIDLSAGGAARGPGADRGAG